MANQIKRSLISTSPDLNAETQRLRFDIGYDGTDFHGWATQPGLRTVQGAIESALRVIVRSPHTVPVLTVGGRTDAGVHARGQVAHVDIETVLATKITAKRMNNLLGREFPDIVISTVTPVSDDFDARFSAVRRRYEYRVASRDLPQDPLAKRFTVYGVNEISVEALQLASDELLGLNDFTSFCKAREGATAVRDLLSFEWTQTDAGVCVARIEADAFCHSMVRSLVGAVCAVGQGQITIEQLRQLRDARERTNRFPVMPSHGLSLEEIVYPKEAELALRAEATRAKRQALPNNGE